MSQDGIRTLMNKILKLCNIIILHMILQVVASFSRINSLRKGEGLGLSLNQTEDRENEVFWQNQNYKPFVMSNLPTSAAKKINYLAYILSDVRVIHCSSEAAQPTWGGLV